MKKIILVGVSLLLFMSCEKESANLESEQVDLTKTAFKGAVFDDWEEFYSYVIKLENLEDELDVLYEIQENDYKSFLHVAINTEDDVKLEIADQLTYGIMAVLNEDLEFVVGNKIIKYVDNNFFESNLDLSSLVEVDNIQISRIPLDEDYKNSSKEARLNVSTNNTAGYSHRDFYRNAYYRCSDNYKVFGRSSRQMRFIQQLKSVYYGGQTGTAFLFVETKLFWRNSRNKLRYAETEERNYIYNLTGNARVNIFTPGGVQNIQLPIGSISPVNCTRNNWNRKQLSTAFPAVGANWSVDITGSITHRINGDSSYWNAPVNWR